MNLVRFILTDSARLISNLRPSHKKTFKLELKEINSNVQKKIGILKFNFGDLVGFNSLGSYQKPSNFTVYGQVIFSLIELLAKWV